MQVTLPPELERYVSQRIQSGEFSTPEEVLAASAADLRVQQIADDEAIRRGIHAMEAGRSAPARDVIAKLRKELRESYPELEE